MLTLWLCSNRKVAAQDSDEIHVLWHPTDLCSNWLCDFGNLLNLSVLKTSLCPNRFGKCWISGVHAFVSC